MRQENGDCRNKVDLGLSIFLASIIIASGLWSIADAIKKLGQDMPDRSKLQMFFWNVGGIQTILSQIRDTIKQRENAKND